MEPGYEPRFIGPQVMLWFTVFYCLCQPAVSRKVVNEYTMTSNSICSFVLYRNLHICSRRQVQERSLQVTIQWQKIRTDPNVPTDVNGYIKHRISTQQDTI